MIVHCTDMRDSRDCGVEDEPLLVLGVEVEVLHLLLPIEQPQADLIPVRGPAPELELEGGQKMTYKQKKCTKPDTNQLQDNLEQDTFVELTKAL